MEYWQALDLNITMKLIDIGLWDTRNQANELMATMMWTHTPLWHNPDWDGHWGREWSEWKNSTGTKGEEPPEDVKRIHHLLDQLFVVPVEEAVDIDNQIRAEMNEHFWFISPLENVKQPLIVNAKLGNIPEEDSGAMAIAVNFSGEQLFYRE